MKEVMKKEIMKWINAGIISPHLWQQKHEFISKCNRNKGITVVANDQNELIPTRTMMYRRICIDYMNLNKATHKGHISLTFIDQIWTC